MASEHCTRKIVGSRLRRNGGGWLRLTKRAWWVRGLDRSVEKKCGLRPRRHVAWLNSGEGCRVAFETGEDHQKPFSGSRRVLRGRRAVGARTLTNHERRDGIRCAVDQMN